MRFVCFNKSNRYRNILQWHQYQIDNSFYDNWCLYESIDMSFKQKCSRSNVFIFTTCVYLYNVHAIFSYYGTFIILIISNAYTQARIF